MDRSPDQLEMRRRELVTASLSRSLADAGVDHLILKGPSTRLRLYPHDVRLSGDVDVLVAPHHRRRGGAVLQELGYSPGARAPHSTPWTARDRLEVDLHLTLPRCSASPRRVWHVLERHQDHLRIGGVDVPVLGPAALCAHLAIHLTQGGGPREHEDLRRAVARFGPTTWAGAARVATEVGASTSLAWALGQVDGGCSVVHALALTPAEARDLPPRRVTERGASAFVLSSVHWRERSRALATTMHKHLGLVGR